MIEQITHINDDLKNLQQRINKANTDIIICDETIIRYGKLLPELVGRFQREIIIRKQILLIISRMHTAKLEEMKILIKGI